MTEPVPHLPETAPFTPAQREWLNGYLAGIFAPSLRVDTHPGEPERATHAPAYDRHRPFPARLLECRLLVESGGEKDTRHLALSLKGSDVAYVPGDALGVIPRNDPALAGAIVDALGCSADHPVSIPRNGSAPIFEALCGSYEIGTPPRLLLEAVARRPELKRLLVAERRAELSRYLHGRDVLDVLTEERASLSPEDLVGLLRPLQHRLYSISSSLATHPDEVHLTVGVVRHERSGRARGGVCSTYLADRVDAGGTVPVFLHENRAFRPPEDPATPLIMVGPGTGIAPFRAFLQERRATGGGRAWLFFGNRNSSRDFLYADELRGMLDDRTLTHLTTAFSRDQPERIYVQHRMIEHAAELYAWLEEGAHFFVCGDASRMAKDVETALERVIAAGGGVTPEAAAAYVQRLRREKRYVRDVY